MDFQDGISAEELRENTRPACAAVAIMLIVSGLTGDCWIAPFWKGHDNSHRNAGFDDATRETELMAQMLPPWVPAAAILVYLGRPQKLTKLSWKRLLIRRNNEAQGILPSARRAQMKTTLEFNPTEKRRKDYGT